MSDDDATCQGIRPWPEFRVPTGIHVSCEEFGLAGHGRLVWGEGNERAPLMFLLDNPGARERRDGMPYVCGTRLTLRDALTDAGLDRDHVYVTYLLKCRPLRAYDREKARSVGLKYFTGQLHTCRPKALVLFGDVVTQALTGNDKTSVKALRGTTMSVENTPTVVTYHPLAARRRPNLYPLLVEDLASSRSLL